MWFLNQSIDHSFLLRGPKCVRKEWNNFNQNAFIKFYYLDRYRQVLNPLWPERANRVQIRFLRRFYSDFIAYNVLIGLICTTPIDSRCVIWQSYSARECAHFFQQTVETHGCTWHLIPILHNLLIWHHASPTDVVPAMSG